jgi:hypothetical protein
MERKRLFNIFIIVFIDLVGFGLILPLAYAGGVLSTVIDSASPRPFIPKKLAARWGWQLHWKAAPARGSPSLGGYLLGSLGAWAPGVVSALIMAWVVSFTWRRLIVNPDPPLPVRETNENRPTMESPILAR